MNFTKKQMVTAINLGVSTLALGFASDMMADANRSMLEEIVVTAQKRAESLQDVPIAVNALTGDMLNDFGVVDSDSLTALYPNLSLKASSSINSGFSIRVTERVLGIEGERQLCVEVNDSALAEELFGEISAMAQEMELMRVSRE